MNLLVQGWSCGRIVISLVGIYFSLAFINISENISACSFTGFDRTSL